MQVDFLQMFMHRVAEWGHSDWGWQPELMFIMTVSIFRLVLLFSMFLKWHSILHFYRPSMLKIFEATSTVFMTKFQYNLIIFVRRIKFIVSKKSWRTFILSISSISSSVSSYLQNLQQQKILHDIVRSVFSVFAVNFDVGKKWRVNNTVTYDQR